MFSAPNSVGHIASIPCIVTVASWCVTQWVAAQFAYSPQLGAAWFVVFHHPVYGPWRLFEWWYAFDAQASGVFAIAGIIVSASGLCSAGMVAVWRGRPPRRAITYGSARWADRREIEKAGLLAPAGVFLGTLRRRRAHNHVYLRHDGAEHVICFAPTRSGKGVGLVLPTLLTWPSSAVIHDIKGENWRATAGWRARFSHAILFDPTDPTSARYNPLLEVRKGGAEVRDVQNIADLLVDPEGSLARRNHWDKTSHALLVGVILHVLYAEPTKTLARVAELLSDPSRSFERTLRIMMATNHLGTKEQPKVHPVVAATARELLNKAENERSGVLSTAVSFLGLYRDPTIARNTEACDWRIADLATATAPVSLYLVVPPSDISRTRPLIRLILNQIGRRLTEDLHCVDGAAKKRPLLMMLDEFPALGRLDFFESALAFMAGYGIRAYLIAQSLNQLAKAYGENNSILDNCHIRIAFSANDERTARRISDALGMATELRTQRNFAGHRLAPWLAHVMVNAQETARPLLTLGEVMQLPNDEAIVLVSGLPPIRAKKLRHYEDANFAARLLPAPLRQTIGGRYGDAPALRADDWSGMQAAEHPRLRRAWFDFGPASDDEGTSSFVDEPLSEPDLLIHPLVEDSDDAGDQSRAPLIANGAARAPAVSRDDHWPSI